MTSHRIALAVTAAVASLAFAGSASAAAPTATLNGSVGPGHTITLKKAGKKVTTLKPGTYKFVVKDLSSSHNFRLMGAKLNKELSGLGATGTKTVTVTLKKGTYTFQCDPHSFDMHGSFKVA